MFSFKNLGMDHVYQHSIMHRVTSLTLRNVNKNDLVESLVLLSEKMINKLKSNCHWNELLHILSPIVIGIVIVMSIYVDTINYCYTRQSGVDIWLIYGFLKKKNKEKLNGNIGNCKVWNWYVTSFTRISPSFFFMWIHFAWNHM